MNTDHHADLYPQTVSTFIEGPEIALAPEDGGKWALYCIHHDIHGEVTWTGVLQDTNKARLARFRHDSTEWCDLCIHEEQGGTNFTFHHPYAFTPTR